MRHEQHPHGPLEPQDVEELLPWYVTGRVSRDEARGIEAALKTMPDLADKLAQVQREREGVARAAEAVEPAPPETLQRLLQQVETTRQRRMPRVESVGEPGTRLKGALARSWVWQAAFAAACVAIVALGIRLYNPSINPGDLDVATDINGVATGTPLSVTFQPTAAAGQIGPLLTQLNATVVSGPTADGTYVVRIPGTQPDDVKAAMDALMSRTDLVLAVQRGS
jgi:anti-sigma-K factor RskA